MSGRRDHNCFRKLRVCANSKEEGYKSQWNFHNSMQTVKSTHEKRFMANVIFYLLPMATAFCGSKSIII